MVLPLGKRSARVTILEKVKERRWCGGGEGGEGRERRLQQNRRGNHIHKELGKDFHKINYEMAKCLTPTQ